MCKNETTLIPIAANEPSPLPARGLQPAGSDDLFERPPAALFRVAATAEEMLTKPELAARLKVTVRTLENWQNTGLLPYYKISGCVLFYWPDVIEHLKTNFRITKPKAS